MLYCSVLLASSTVSIIRPHHLHAVCRCGLLLQMSHVAWSVCLSLCVSGTRVSCAKTAEPIEMAFGGLTHVGPHHVLIET